VFVRKSIISALLTLLASNFANLSVSAEVTGANANETSQITTDESGSKSLGLHIPTVVAKPTPCVSWLPAEGKPRVALLCIHGFSLHKGCFAAFGKEMAKDGIAVYATDLRGFGELKDAKETSGIDFDGCLVDIKATLQKMHSDNPGVPVVILGESMGGAVALRAAALYPQLISGLIASVPARDRFGMSEAEKKVTVKSLTNALTGSYGKPMEGAAFAAVQKISAKEDVRSQWKSDPLMRTDFSAKDFVQFDEFMKGNLIAAPYIKQTPVLFLQGTNDKLIRPEGTWKLYERLATPNRQIVLSKNSEHLIFEEGQFKPDDLRFVTTWIDRNVTPLDPAIANSMGKLPVVASVKDNAGSEIASAGGTQVQTASGAQVESATAKIQTAGNVSADSIVGELSGAAPKPAQDEFKNRIASKSPQINFWIELNRDNKTFRCNNKMEFKTGDKIRFHLIPGSDGFAYLVMKAGTTGKSDVLFPNAKYGTQNHLTQGKDYPIPAIGWMQFDQHPGTEQLGLVYASTKVDVTPESLKNRTMTAFVSSDQSGSKDLCPTRMKLSWDNPMPVMIPDDFSAIAQVQNADDSSLVRLGASNGGMISASISLLHNNNR
jgi:acylglycerol lipase